MISFGSTHAHIIWPFTEISQFNHNFNSQSIIGKIHHPLMIFYYVTKKTSNQNHFSWPSRLLSTQLTSNKFSTTVTALNHFMMMNLLTQDFDWEVNEFVDAIWSNASHELINVSAKQWILYNERERKNFLCWASAMRCWMFGAKKIKKNFLLYRSRWTSFVSVSLHFSLSLVR